MTYFVWIASQTGPQPQLWVDEPVDGNGKSTKSVLFKQKISSEDERLTFNELVLKFNKDKPVDNTNQ